MSRRDTIIIAVLVNAGLMALLFMLAINTEEEKNSNMLEFVQTVAESPKPSVYEAIMPQVSIPIALGDLNGSDEVDAFLKDLAITEYVPSETNSGLENESFITPSNNSERKIATQHDDSLLHYVDVTVKRGDALEKIARHNGTTIEAIRKANNLTSTKLSIGQVLRIPVSQKSGTTTAVAEAVKDTAPKISTNDPKGASEPQYYTIKSGDNPWKIAKQFQVRFDDLLKLNELDEDKARNLKIGDKIRVR